jgi:hypothetical protein
MDKRLNLEFPPTPDEYRANIRRQKALALVIARKMQRGVTLKDWEVGFVAHQLRARAESLNEVMPKRRGRPPIVNYSEVARDYVLLVQDGVSKSMAKEILAVSYGVAEVDTIDDALKAKLAAAEDLYGPAQGK